MLCTINQLWWITFFFSSDFNMLNWSHSLICRSFFTFYFSCRILKHKSNIRGLFFLIDFSLLKKAQDGWIVFVVYNYLAKGSFHAVFVLLVSQLSKRMLFLMTHSQKLNFEITHLALKSKYLSQLQTPLQSYYLLCAFSSLTKGVNLLSPVATIGPFHRLPLSLQHIEMTLGLAGGTTLCSGEVFWEQLFILILVDKLSCEF